MKTESVQNPYLIYGHIANFTFFDITLHKISYLWNELNYSVHSKWVSRPKGWIEGKKLLNYEEGCTCSEFFREGKNLRKDIYRIRTILAYLHEWHSDAGHFLHGVRQRHRYVAAGEIPVQNSRSSDNHLWNNGQSRAHNRIRGKRCMCQIVQFLQKEAKVHIYKSWTNNRLGQIPDAPASYW